ncbi:MAG: YfhO family protein [Chloroflexota bacterium]
MVGLSALACLTTWELVRDGMPIGMDTATAFYPWYVYLGENLRNGHIPMWNPHQFAGSPFAADPESGWAYLPAMLVFAVLPLTQAASTFLLFHLLLAGLATYALARSLGIRPLGAVAGAIAYSYSGFFLGHALCCFAYSNVATWLPVALLGIELAISHTSLAQRDRGWAIGGLALSQILAAWLGQGAYYALLFLGGYIMYRTLVGSRLSLGCRLKSMLLHGGMLLLVGCGLAAIGVLPRLEYNALSNLPGGYGAAGLSSPTAALTDWGIIEDWQARLLSPGFHYVGLVTLALALSAPPLVRARHAAPFFVVVSMAGLVLARWQPTPLHVALSVLPGFGPMHVHAPERALLVWFIGPAILAGAAIGHLQAFGRGGAALAVLLTALVLVDLRVAGHAQLAAALEAGGAYELHHVDLDAYYAPTGAARFLQSATAVDRARTIGYAQHVLGGPIPYTLGWANPKTVALGVNNRALLSGLGDVQGYNPIHLARYDVFMRALNGQAQDYHQTDVFEAGLRSPLLDLLGVRYIVVPVVPAADQVEPRLARDLPAVYANADVKVLENDRALPRAWIVHSAAQMTAEEAVAQLAGGAIDPRRTAMLEKPLPPLGTSPFASDQAKITEYAADAVQLDVDTGAPGLLVLSDAYYPAWQARVDDSPTEVYVVDGALRGVAIPAGRHTVVFRYASAALPVGAAITGLTVCALTGRAALRRRRTRCA